MVQKYCPGCKEWIPVACKTCPCGHKFAKTVAESSKRGAEETEDESQLGRQENGRPRRKSAMNSLYYHSSLHLSSYKLTKQAATVSKYMFTPRSGPGIINQKGRARKRSTETDSADNPSGATNGDSESTTNGHLPKKRRRGRPRLRPHSYSELDGLDEDSKTESSPVSTKESFPILRRRPGLISTNMARSGDMYGHSNYDSESKPSKNKAINESESYSKLYQTLSDAKRKHFAFILDDINFKFKRNANFPL